MRTHGYLRYFDNEVMAASPVKLIEMLYGAALDSISAARRHIRQRDIGARTHAINKALRIVSELSRSLDREAGGEMSRNLAGIYAFVVRLLVEANFTQCEAPLIEAESLISTIAEAWKAGCSAATVPNPSAALKCDRYAAVDSVSATH